MARQMVDEGAQIWRVVVCKVKRIMNPEYDWETAAKTGQPYFIYDEDQRYNEYYGPYSSEAIAKSQIKVRCQDRDGELYPDIRSAHYEKAEVVWSYVGSLQ